MTKLVVFCFALIGLVAVMNLDNYSSVAVNNTKFDMAEAEKKHATHVKDLEELAAMRDAINNPKKVEEEVVEEAKPTVVLDTPQLENGAKQYAKCIVCHGKYGEGKKAQNAPRLAGQMDWYLTKQLVDMKSGARVNKVMDPYLRKLTEQDMKDLGTYLSKLDWNYKK